MMTKSRKTTLCRSGAEAVHLAEAALNAGEYERARQFLKEGAELGEAMCNVHLGLMFDLGYLGCEIDKTAAMDRYKRAWRRGRLAFAAANIAALYGEAGKRRARFQWLRRAAEAGLDDVLVPIARCYLNGDGVRISPGHAAELLRAAVSRTDIEEDIREEAIALIKVIHPSPRPGRLAGLLPVPPMPTDRLISISTPRTQIHPLPTNTLLGAVPETE